MLSPQNIHALLTVIGEILSNLLNVNDPIIKQRTIELLHLYMLHSPHVDIVQKAANSLDLQMMFTNFFDKQVKCQYDIMKPYVESQMKFVFVHECKDNGDTISTYMQNGDEPKSKKFKLNGDDSVIFTILNRIQADIQHLKQLTEDVVSNDSAKAQLNIILQNLSDLL